MIELDSTTFVQAIDTPDLVVVDFWAPWCMPCKIFAPVLEELSDELDGKATFCKVNIDDNADLAQKYNISSIPTVVLFKSGEAEDQFVGVKSKEFVMEAVSKHL